MSKHIQTQTEWEQTMARRVMEQLRGELYLDQRYLTAALGALPPAPQQGGGRLGGNGVSGVAAFRFHHVFSFSPVTLLSV